MATDAKNRRYPRVGLPKGMLVAWQSTGERIVSRVATVGLGGLFISTPEPPPAGETVKLFSEWAATEMLLCLPSRLKQKHRSDVVINWLYPS